jgi:hypothetical protein
MMGSISKLCKTIHHFVKKSATLRNDVVCDVDWLSAIGSCLEETGTETKGTPGTPNNEKKFRHFPRR